MTQFEIVALRLLCKILNRMLQVPGARGTIDDLHYIDEVQVIIHKAKEANKND